MPYVCTNFIILIDFYLHVMLILGVFQVSLLYNNFCLIFKNPSFSLSYSLVIKKIPFYFFSKHTFVNFSLLSGKANLCSILTFKSICKKVRNYLIWTVLFCSQLIPRVCKYVPLLEISIQLKKLTIDLKTSCNSSRFILSLSIDLKVTFSGKSRCCEFLYASEFCSLLNDSLNLRKVGHKWEYHKCYLVQFLLISCIFSVIQRLCY